MIENQGITGAELQCRNEYSTLQRVLMCAPTHMQIIEVINETQKHFLSDNIDVSRAVRQFETFVDVLKKRGIEVDLLPVNPLLPEQVFVRDIGVMVDHQLLRSRLYCGIRQGEEIELEEWLHRHDIPSASTTDFLEGGDVVLDRETLWVGVGNRTSRAVVGELRNLFPHREVIPLEFDAAYLHLDCVFNVLSPHVALIFQGAFEPDTVRMLGERYELIEVSEEEQFTLAANVLSLGEGHVISLPQNIDANLAMLRAGLTVHEIDLSEIIKSGGSFRCITLPLCRID